MDDDFNTGAATAVLFELLRSLNKFVDTEKLEAGKPDAAKVAIAGTRRNGPPRTGRRAGIVPQTGRTEIGGGDAIVGNV